MYYSLPILSIEYILLFLKKPRGLEYGERNCINDVNCICINPVIHSTFQVETLVIGKEFLLPNELIIYQRDNIFPKQPRSCLFCLLYNWTTNVYNEMIKTKKQIEEDGEPTLMNIFCANTNMQCLITKTRYNTSTGIYGYCPMFHVSLFNYFK